MRDWLLKLLFRAEYEQIKRIKTSPDGYIQTPDDMLLASVSVWVEPGVNNTTLIASWVELPTSSSIQ